MNPSRITRRTAIGDLTKGFVLLASGLYARRVEAATTQTIAAVMAGQARRAVAASSVSYVLQENFEYPTVGFDNNNANGWTTNDTVDPVSATITLEGTQCCKLGYNATNGSISVGFAELTNIYLYMLFQATGTNNSILVSLKNSATVVARAQYVSSGGNKFLIQDDTSSPNVTTIGAWLANTKYHVWIKHLAGTGANSTGSIGFSSDGVEPTSGDDNYAGYTNGNATLAVDNITILNVGAVKITYVDKIRISSSPIGNNPS